MPESRQYNDKSLRLVSLKESNKTWILSEKKINIEKRDYERCQATKTKQKSIIDKKLLKEFHIDRHQFVSNRHQPTYCSISAFTIDPVDLQSTPFLLFLSVSAFASISAPISFRFR
jgi:hypothetical protein